MTDGHNTGSGAPRRGELCLAADGKVALSLKIVEASIEPPVVDKDAPVFTSAQEERICELILALAGPRVPSIEKILQRLTQVTLPEDRLAPRPLPGSDA